MADFDTQVDVLVIGAGGAGLAAAIAASDLGASVAVVEKLPRPGGNTGLSTGSIPGAGTRFQRLAGIDDNPQKMTADLLGLSGDHDATDLTRMLSERSAELVEWLVDKAHIRLDIIKDYKHVAHSVPRLHAPASRKGADLVHDLVAAVERRGVPIVLSNPVVDLILGKNGEVIGATTRTAQNAVSRIGAGKTILCVNGFGASQQMLAQYCPEIAGAMYSGAKGSEGEAIRWGAQLNARLGNMASYQGYATLMYPHGELLSWTTIEKGGVLVNDKGLRFGDESIGYSGFAAPVIAQSGKVHAIFDQRIRDIAAKEPWFKEILDMGGAKKAIDVPDLASKLAVDPAALQKTLSAYGQGSDEFGRKDIGIAPLQAPYWYTQVVGGLLSTQGGLMIDQHARVLDKTDRTIPNLYAAGGAVASISGRSGGVGYASGSGLLHAIGLGWIAGTDAANAVANPSHSR